MFAVFSEEEQFSQFADFEIIHRRVLEMSFGRHLSKKQAIFSDKTAVHIRNWFCIYVSFLTDILNKRQTSLDASRETASRNFEKSGPETPVARVKHACDVAEASILGFHNQFIIRDGIHVKKINERT